MNSLTVAEQWAEYERVGTDTRPRVGSGWSKLDDLLYRSSFGPGTFCILAGRMHTRKTAVMSNLVANMLAQDVPVGLVGLDEAPNMYVAKLASVFTQRSHLELDDLWGTGAMQAVEKQYKKDAKLLSITTAPRPSLDNLSAWLELCEVSGSRPRVVFIDYLSLLERGRFDGKDQTRIPRLCEDLQVWTNKHELVTFALHQVGRQDDNATRRYHGHTPISPEQLMYGGEQQADIILGTYRPALDPVGNLTQDAALADGIDASKWQEAADRVFSYKNDTFLQLVKNRPGVKLDYHGIQLRSTGYSQKMEPV